eukprot:3554332-Lingulodinium_polyedra.AAC.1
MLSSVAPGSLAEGVGARGGAHKTRGPPAVSPDARVAIGRFRPRRSSVAGAVGFDRNLAQVEIVRFQEPA